MQCVNSSYSRGDLLPGEVLSFDVFFELEKLAFNWIKVCDLASLDNCESQLLYCCQPALSGDEFEWGLGALEFWVCQLYHYRLKQPMNPNTGL